jgi:hypothetical protein
MSSDESDALHRVIAANIGNVVEWFDFAGSFSSL